MANISRSFYSDLSSARRAQRQDAMPVVVTRLTKSGQPSKMAEDTNYFRTVEEAQAHIDSIAKLNPTRTFTYEIRTR